MGMEKGLGLTLDFEPYILRPCQEKLKALVLRTEGLALKGQAIPREVASLLGLWTWIMLLNRPALSIPDKIFKWLHSFDETEETKIQMIWGTVRSEMMAMASLSVYFESRLETPWWSQVYMTRRTRASGPSSRTAPSTR